MFHYKTRTRLLESCPSFYLSHGIRKSVVKGDLINLYRRAFNMFLYRMFSSYCQNWATGITSSCRFTEVARITIPTADMLILVLGLQAAIMTITFCSFHSLSLTISGQYLNMDHS
jgi:hypothetical protein